MALLVGALCLDNVVAATDVPFTTEHTIDGAFAGAWSVYAGDVDGDGDTDVLGAAALDDEITWWENTLGNGTIWSKHTIDDAFDTTASVHAADVDGDGDIDILGAAESDREITWWENTEGNGTIWDEHTISNTFAGAHSVYAADVDGDGDLDVLGAAWIDNDITWWENTAGDGTNWSEHPINSAFINAFSVYAADVDDDGDLDVLGAAGDRDITWWENTAGDGTNWSEHTIDPDFSGAHSVHAADVDGDGDLDVLGAAFVIDEITWWENTLGDGTTWSKHTVDSNFASAKSVYAGKRLGNAPRKPYYPSD